MAQHNVNGSGPYAEADHLRFAHIVGWGMAVPENAMTNDDLAAIVETSDEWIRTRTGIEQRYIANERETTASLGLKAAQNALNMTDILPAELDLIIVATSTPENIFPSTASLIQNWLGASRAGAFDLSAACSGFVYAVNMAAQSIRSGSISTAIVVGAETMSRILDWNDRSTCILFGDGAGAVVLEASDQPGGVKSAVLRSDGSGYDLLGVPTVGSIDIAYRQQQAHKMSKMHMNGREVFKFATRIMGDCISQALSDAHLTLDDIDVIVPHQANDRILQSAARNLKLDKDKFISTVAKYGNTSAASIPIALCEAIAQGRVKNEDHLVFVGFGGGLTWAAMVVQWGAPQEDPNAFNKQRRRFTYLLARWRARWSRYRRRLDRQINRIRPNAGRMNRLRSRVDDDRFDW